MWARFIIQRASVVARMSPRGRLPGAQTSRGADFKGRSRRPVTCVTSVAVLAVLACGLFCVLLKATYFCSPLTSVRLLPTFTSNYKVILLFLLLQNMFRGAQSSYLALAAQALGNDTVKSMIFHFYKKIRLKQ